jgi:hypothetical protein
MSKSYPEIIKWVRLDVCRSQKTSTRLGRNVTMYQNHSLLKRKRVRYSCVSRVEHGQDNSVVERGWVGSNNPTLFTTNVMDNQLAQSISRRDARVTRLLPHSCHLKILVGNYIFNSHLNNKDFAGVSFMRHF